MKSLSSPIISITFLIAVLLSMVAMWTNLQAFQRNLVLIGRLSVLADPSYGRENVLKIDISSRTTQSQALISASCQGRTIDAQACTRALMGGVDAGMNLDQLLPYLEILSNYPAERSIFASYAGEIWYRTNNIDDAIMVWSDWLDPLQRIDKIGSLYDAGQVQTAILLIKSLDLATRIESSVRRAEIIRVLVPLAEENTRNQDHVAAEMYWRWASLQYPERPAYHFNLATALQRQDKYEEALSSLLSATYLRPESISYQLRLAQIYEVLDRRQEAKEAALRALKINPDNQTAKSLLERLTQ